MPKTVLCAAVAVVLLAACGDSGGAGSTTTLAGVGSTTTVAGPATTTTDLPATTTPGGTITSAAPGATTTTPGGTSTTASPTTTAAQGATTTSPQAPPAATGASLQIDGQPVDLTYQCTGNPLVGLFTRNVVSTGADPVLLEIWGEETGEVGYILQYGAGGPIYEGFYDGDAADPFTVGSATLDSETGDLREITYEVPGGEPCSQVAQLTDADDPFSGLRFDVADVCATGGGNHVVWLNEGAVLDLELEGQGGGGFQAVLRDVLFGLEDRTVAAEPGTWQRTADGGLSGTAVLYEDGDTDIDPFFLEFDIAGALIRTCS